MGMGLGRAAGPGPQEQRADEAHERGERVEEPVLHDGGGTDVSLGFR
jgi:hypothetical protein